MTELSTISNLSSAEPNKVCVCVCVESMCTCLCVFSVCICKCTNVTVLGPHSSLKESDLKGVIQPCWFEETGVEGGNRQRASKSYKHWSSRGSGAGLEEQLLNIQRQNQRDQAWTEMKQQATFLRPSHIIHFHVKDGTGRQSWSFQKGVRILLVYLCRLYVLCVYL